MKNLLVILLSLVVVFGCEDKDKEHKDCDCQVEQMDAEVGGSDESDMGLDGGSEEDQGGEDAGAEQEELDGGQDASDEEDCEDCEGEDCDC